VEGVEVAQPVGFYFDILLDEQVILLGTIMEDDMGPPDGTTDIRAEHDLVWGITTKGILYHAYQQPTTTELDDDDNNNNEVVAV